MDYMQFVRVLIFVQCFACHNAKAVFDELSSNAKNAIVNGHNRCRSAVLRASNMKKLEWDNELASKAQATIDGCSYTAPDYSTGKNLFFKQTTFFGINMMSFVTEAVDSWCKGSIHYNYHTNHCKVGGCGQYKQMVWADTSKIGCGVNSCVIINDITPEVLLCYYTPGISKQSGERTVGRPYEWGTPCSMCGDGYSCKNNMCLELASSNTVTETAAYNYDNYDNYDWPIEDMS